MADPRDHTGLDASFVELYEERYEPMVRLAFLLIGERAVAEELVQDAFVKVHRHWAKGIEHPNAYLRTAVVNTCRSWGRKRFRERDHQRRHLSVVETTPFVADELGDALDRLPDRQRAAIVLRFYEDLPETEIASALGCRPSTVRSLVHRGLAALRREIQP
ncbi:MAG: SigE family RNA polymerase sigma factor [Actinobacteria bacterium]|nr:SigE family RNA polymerase sigma factor [Actinomycetota bacterium]